MRELIDSSGKPETIGRTAVIVWPVYSQSAAWSSETRRAASASSSADASGSV